MARTKQISRGQGSAPRLQLATKPFKATRKSAPTGGGKKDQQQSEADCYSRMDIGTRSKNPTGRKGGSLSPVDSKGLRSSSNSKATRSHGSNVSSASRGSPFRSEKTVKKRQIISNNDDFNNGVIKDENGSDDMDAKMDGDKMFKCQECQENYTADGLNPIMPILLDCGHDICRDCAKKLLCDTGVLCCPDISCKMKHERYPLDSLPIIWALIKRNQNNLTSGKSHPSVINKITVFLKFPCGNNIPLNVYPTVTINDFIQICSNKLGYSLVGIRFIYKGRNFQHDLDGHISDYDIGDKSHIDIVYQLRGD